MANTKKQPAKKQSSNALVKTGSAFKRFFLKIGNAFKNTWRRAAQSHVADQGKAG